jgi:hypothetical protein
MKPGEKMETKWKDGERIQRVDNVICYTIRLGTGAWHGNLRRGTKLPGGRLFTAFWLVPSGRLWLPWPRTFAGAW